MNVRVEELNRTVIDITSHKTRLSQVTESKFWKFLDKSDHFVSDVYENGQENIELTKEVQDLKIQIENVTYLKSQVAGQLEDARRRLEDDERVSTKT